MNRQPNYILVVLCSLLAAAQLACVPSPPQALTPSPTPEPSGTRPPINTPVRTPTPGATSTPGASPTPGATSTPVPTFAPTATFTPTSRVPTATLFPSSTPLPSPIPTRTPRVEIKFKSIQMPDPWRGWALAEIGERSDTHILRTEDGGWRWRDVSPRDDNFVGAFFLDSYTAWAWTRNAEPAWRTLDGGQSWEPVGEFGWQPDLGFVDTRHGWKLNAEVWGLSFRQFDIVSFATTDDGGKTWQAANQPPGRGSAYMAYPSQQTAWAVRAGFANVNYGGPNLGAPFRIEATFDGGQTWTTRKMPVPPDAYLVERRYEGTYLGGAGNCEIISPVYSSIAIWRSALVCETHSWLYTSANQGKTWIISSMPVGQFADLHFVNPTTGWLLVRSAYDDNQGRLYQTTNGGQSWNLIKHTGWSGVQMSFLNEQTGWAIASTCPEQVCSWFEDITALVKTTNGGQTWRLIRPRLVR